MGAKDAEESAKGVMAEASIGNGGTDEIMEMAGEVAEMTALGAAVDTTDRMIREIMGREGDKEEGTAKGGEAGITNEDMMTIWALVMATRTTITLVVVATEIEVSVGVT